MGNDISSTSFLSKASVGGLVKDADSKKSIAKSLGDMDGPALMDLETGAFKAKKAKREKTPAEKAVSDLKAFEKKTLVQIGTAAFTVC